MSAGFAGSPEAAIRKLVRDAIKRSGMSRSERDVATVLVNLWFHHRNGPAGYIHPGRKLIAKRAKCCEKTVMRSLAKLRDAGALIVVSHAHGGKNTATRYKVDLTTLLAACGIRFPEVISGLLLPLNVPQSEAEMSRNRGDKMSPCISDVQRFPSQPEKTCVVIPFRTVGGKR